MRPAPTDAQDRGRAVSGLLVGLDDPAASVRQAAAEAMGWLGMRGQDRRLRRGVVERLIRSLDDEDWSVRQAAAKALSAIGGSAPGPLEPLATALGGTEEMGAAAIGLLAASGERAVALLSAALCDSTANIRTRAASALGRMGRTVSGTAARGEAVRALLTAATDSDANVRTETVQALGSLTAGLRDEALCAAVLAALVSLLDDPAEPVRNEAARALDASGLPLDPATQARQARIQLDWDLLAGLGSAAIAPLASAVEDEREDVPLHAVRTLGRVAPSLTSRRARTRVVELLSGSTGHAAAAVRLAAVEALAGAGCGEAVPALIRIVEGRGHSRPQDLARWGAKEGWERRAVFRTARR